MYVYIYISLSLYIYILYVMERITYLRITPAQGVKGPAQGSSDQNIKKALDVCIVFSPLKGFIMEILHFHNKHIEKPL